MVEGTTDSRVSDDRSEDIRTVDKVPLPSALPQHEGRILGAGVRGARQGRLPEQTEEVGVSQGKLFLGLSDKTEPSENYLS